MNDNELRDYPAPTSGVYRDSWWVSRLPYNLWLKTVDGKAWLAFLDKGKIMFNENTDSDNLVLPSWRTQTPDECYIIYQNNLPRELNGVKDFPSAERAKTMLISYIACMGFGLDRAYKLVEEKLVFGDIRIVKSKKILNWEVV